MPPRLAYHRLKQRSTPEFSLYRTLWDEVCSIYLCFISPLLEKAPIRDVPGVFANMLLYLGDTLMLWPQYQSNPTVVAAFKSAAVKLFPDRQWTSPPHDAGSELWWDRL